MNVYFSDEQDVPVDGAALRALAERVLAAQGLPDGTEMALMLIGPAQMAAYQEEFMGRSGPTDVLSFPVADLEPGVPPRRMANDPPVALGDVFVCPEVVAARIEEEDLEPGEYSMERLVVHGILHLLGYDHPDDDEEAANVMQDREDELLAGGGRS